MDPVGGGASGGGGSSETAGFPVSDLFKLGAQIKAEDDSNRRKSRLTD